MSDAVDPQILDSAALDSAALDAADPLAEHVHEFLPGADLVAYLDGNSLGRPLRRTVDSMPAFLQQQWGDRLIRGWDEGWLSRAEELGDRIGAACLGAEPGQTIVGDSTTVLIFKLLRASLAARPGRDELVLMRDEFPTDRFIAERLAEDHGLTIRWVEAPLDAGPTPELIAEHVSERTAAALMSGVAYRSAWWADMPAITGVVQAQGALMIWDCSHAVGSVPLQLDAWGVDMAVGCSYKYLNGGPGAPAWAYVAARHLEQLRNPIPGWLGAREPFAMTSGYEPAVGIRRLVSGTPPIVGMLPLADMLDLVERAGIDAIRAKSVALTSYAIALIDELIPDARLASPRNADRRGSHLTIDHPNSARAVKTLWGEGVIPDFRHPSGVRIGLSPLSTNFAEVERGVRALATALA